MKTNYEKIKAILDSGYKAKVEYIDYIGYHYGATIDIDEFKRKSYEVKSIFKGKIKSIIPIPTKPPILKVGDEVVVLDNVRDFEKMYIGKVGIIQEIYDDNSGVAYFIEFGNFGELEYYQRLFPHYTVCLNYND